MTPTVTTRARLPLPAGERGRGAGRRPSRRLPRSAALALLAALAWPAAALAYDQATHRILTTRALDGLPSGEPALVKEADLVALRVAVHQAGAGHPEPGVRARFLARWPSAERFDGWSLKELAGLTPEAVVVGLDVPPPPALNLRAAAAAGAVVPDDDRRNQERYAHAPDRSVRRDTWGRPLPADPAQLHMGKLAGLSSQAHAHYGLPAIERSDDPAVLERDPRRFSVPKDALTFAADFAQVHTDLALGAATLEGPGAAPLAWALLGQGQHYLEDLANQIHTLQAVYPFFVSAKLESLREDALTLGGLLGERRGFLPIGIHIISNHHLFTEALWASRVQAAEAGRPDGGGAGQAGLEAAAAGDPALERALDGLALGPEAPFARALALALCDASSLEGGEVYLRAREVARSRLSTAAYEFTDGGDPEADLDAGADPRSLARFMELQRNGFGRAGTVVRRHARLFREAVEAAGGSEAGRLALRQRALGRFVADGLAALEAREARLAGWTPSPPPRATVSWGWPAGLAALLAGVALLARWRRRRRRAA